MGFDRTYFIDEMGEYEALRPGVSFSIPGYARDGFSFHKSFDFFVRSLLAPAALRLRRPAPGPFVAGGTTRVVELFDIGAANGMLLEAWNRITGAPSKGIDVSEWIVRRPCAPGLDLAAACATSLVAIPRHHPLSAQVVTMLGVHQYLTGAQISKVFRAIATSAADGSPARIGPRLLWLEGVYDNSDDVAADENVVSFFSQRELARMMDAELTAASAGRMTTVVSTRMGLCSHATVLELTEAVGC